MSIACVQLEESFDWLCLGITNISATRIPAVGILSWPPSVAMVSAPVRQKQFVADSQFKYIQKLEKLFAVVRQLRISVSLPCKKKFFHIISLFLPPLCSVFMLEFNQKSFQTQNFHLSVCTFCLSCLI